MDEKDERLVIIKGGEVAYAGGEGDELDKFGNNEMDEEEDVMGDKNSKRSSIELKDYLCKKSQQELVGILIQFQFTEVLIDIAIHEKNIDEVVHWYDIRTKKHQSPWGWEDSLDDRVAGAIAEKYSERSIAIWKKMADSHIAWTNPKEYSTAARFLRKVQKTMKANGMDIEWERYISKLKSEHARKKRFIEILNSISGKPIFDG